LVHFFKTTSRVGVKTTCKDSYKQAREDFTLDKTHAICAKGLNGENVLTIKQARDEEPA
jgi:hypothetical protein